MKINIIGLVTAWMMLFAGNVLADGQSATRNLFMNLELSKVDVSRLLGSLGTNLEVATVVPTLVRGLYAIQERNGGKPILFTNEAGTLLGGSDVIYAVSVDGSSLRPLTPSELAGLRTEVMENIYYDKLIKSQFGNGGGRRLLLRSAINCPACKAYEEGLFKAEALKHSKGDSMDTTFYVIPSSLDELEPNGWNSWKVVSSLWCVRDNEKAWQSYWLRKEVPNADISHCAFAPREAARADQALAQILVGISGTKSSYVPQVFREDGSLMNIRASRDSDYGALGKPEARNNESRWLLNAKEESRFSSQPIGKLEKNKGISLKQLFK